MTQQELAKYLGDVFCARASALGIYDVASDDLVAASIAIAAQIAKAGYPQYVPDGGDAFAALLPSYIPMDDLTPAMLEADQPEIIAKADEICRTCFFRTLPWGVATKLHDALWDAAQYASHYRLTIHIAGKDYTVVDFAHAWETAHPNSDRLPACLGNT